MMDFYNYARMCFAAGLKSIGNAEIDRVAERLIETVDLSVVATQDEDFARYALRTKLLVYMPLLRDHITPESNPLLWGFYDCRRTLTKVSQPILDEAYDILTRENIDVMAYKGTDMLYYYGNVLGERFSFDVDPIVKPEDLERVDDALKAKGFVVAHVDRTRLSPDGTTLWHSPVPKEDIDWVRHNHHETHPYFKIIELPELTSRIDIVKRMKTLHVVEGRIFALPNVDVHWSIGSGVEPVDLWQPPQRSVILPSGTVVPAISAELNLCLQCGRAYSIAMALRDDTSNYMVDAFRIALHPDELNWDRVLSFAEKYRIEAGLYHVLDWLNLFRPESVPSEVIKRLGIYLLNHREYDLGDHLSRLLGVIPKKRFEFM